MDTADRVPAGDRTGLFIVTNALLTVAVGGRAAADSGTRRNRNKQELFRSRRDPGATSEEPRPGRLISRRKKPASAVRLTERSNRPSELLIGYVTSGTTRLVVIAVVVRHFQVTFGGRGFDHDRSRISPRFTPSARCVGVAGGHVAGIHGLDA